MTGIGRLTAWEGWEVIEEPIAKPADEPVLFCAADGLIQNKTCFESHVH
jgi:hypothetical protein